MTVQQEPQATKTITTAKLREIAHTLGASVEYTRQVLSSEYDVQIDDTPDTGEQSMTTITEEQFEAARKRAIERAVDTASLHNRTEYSRLFAEELGFTIAPPEPPEAMVNLAREIAESETQHWPAVKSICTDVAIAALQHAVAKAEKPLQSYADPVTGDLYIHLRTYLRELGAA